VTQKKQTLASTPYLTQVITQFAAHIAAGEGQETKLFDVKKQILGESISIVESLTKALATGEPCSDGIGMFSRSPM
jgi:hypothetical protein